MCTEQLCQSMAIKRVVLDVLKPHSPRLSEFTTALNDGLIIDGITASLVEIDEDVRSIRVVIEGDDLDLDEIGAQINDLGASIHSMDQLSCGDRIIEDQPIRQR